MPELQSNRVSVGSANSPRTMEVRMRPYGRARAQYGSRGQPARGDGNPTVLSMWAASACRSGGYWRDMGYRIRPAVYRTRPAPSCSELANSVSQSDDASLVCRGFIPPAVHRRAATLAAANRAPPGRPRILAGNRRGTGERSLRGCADSTTMRPPPLSPVSGAIIRKWPHS